jgi:hypothetical protein
MTKKRKEGLSKNEAQAVVSEAASQMYFNYRHLGMKHRVNIEPEWFFESNIHRFGIDEDWFKDSVWFTFVNIMIAGRDTNGRTLH